MRKLNEHLVSQNLCSDEQFGYKKNHSTETLLVKLSSDIHSALDKNFGVVLVSIDFSSAFDTVDHGSLLYILKNVINIRDSALDWFKCYLSDRRQRVKIGHTYSNFLPVGFGVPQGSILGPVLYNIYSRSIITVFKNHDFGPLGFADDNEGAFAFTHYFQNEILLDKVPNLLSSLQLWADSHHLLINPPKTEIILFGSPSFHENISLIGLFTNDNICIRFSESIKHVGFYLDKHLDLHSQVNNLVSSCYFTLRHIASIRKYISTENCTQLVISYVTSKLDYCNSLYVGCSRLLIQKLQKV